MKNNTLIFIILTCTLLACKANLKKDQENILVPTILKQEEPNSKIKLSEIITDHYRIIPLETKKECLIGSINKIVKSDSIFYVLSNESKIQTFSYEGKYLSTLEKIGRGPEEYTYIGDFDV